MSQAAAYFEPALRNVKDLNYDSWQTIYFQRTTVILTELVLVYALHLYCSSFSVFVNSLTVMQLCQDVQVQSDCARSCAVDSAFARPSTH